MDVSTKFCPSEMRNCGCESVQLLLVNASQTLAVDLQCSCVFQKPVNCSEIKCSSSETSTDIPAATDKDSTISEISTMLMSATTSIDGTTTPGMCNHNCEAALGSVTGILGGLLIAVVIGWIITCVIISRRGTYGNADQRLAIETLQIETITIITRLACM